MNANIKKIKYDIGFSDSEVLSYQSEKFNLIIYLQAWNGVLLKIEFIDCIYFSNFRAVHISDIYENPSSKSLQLALDTRYEKVPIDHGYKLYQLLDLNDDPAIEVASKDILITRAKD
ncbi:MAG: hypothetical protein BGO14_00875 [Chlamydiales bacterium 38-26]|nr:hypothetical protein [Chlamydiales bacterium]OJV07275.1 MAG: hypothetical protein BGO14_00875 [Chlamydiales bacterium 38-26]